MERKNKKNIKDYKRITIHGFMTSGKTTLGKIISRKLNLKFFDTDIEFKKKHGRISEFVKKHGFKRFREIEKEIFNSLLKKENVVISCGGGIFPKKTKDTLTISLLIPFKKLEKRLTKYKNARPLLRDFPKNKNEIIKLYEKRKTKYQKADLIIKHSNIKKIVDKIEKIWKIS